MDNRQNEKIDTLAIQKEANQLSQLLKANEIGLFSWQSAVQKSAQRLYKLLKPLVINL